MKRQVGTTLGPEAENTELGSNYSGRDKTATSRAGAAGTKKKGTSERHCGGRLTALRMWVYGKGGEWKTSRILASVRSLQKGNTDLLLLRSCEGLINSGWDEEESFAKEVTFKLSTYCLRKISGVSQKKK